MQKCSHCSCCESNKCCIDSVPIFDSLSFEEKMEVVEIASSRSFAKGEPIYSQGDEGGTLFVVHVGQIKLFRLNSGGKEQVLRFVKPGEFMGELSLFSSLPLTDNAIALEETTMCILEGDRLKDLMGKYPSIAFKVMDELSRRLEKAEDQIEDISISSVEKRIARALLNLAEGKNEIRLPMSKGDLASHLGITRETFSRKLTALQDEGLIVLRGQRDVTLKNRQGLEDISLED